MLLENIGNLIPLACQPSQCSQPDQKKKHKGTNLNPETPHHQSCHPEPQLHCSSNESHPVTCFLLVDPSVSKVPAPLVPVGHRPQSIRLDRDTRLPSSPARVWLSSPELSGRDFIHPPVSDGGVEG